MYKVKYLPSAEQDLLGIVTYIAVDLANPQAAEDLYSCSIGNSDRNLRSDRGNEYY
jgi:hypothetical protein